VTSSSAKFHFRGLRCFTRNLILFIILLDWIPFEN